MQRVEVVVDNRLRMNANTLGESCCKEIIEAFTRKNPEYYKKQAMGFWVGEMLPTISTVEMDVDSHELSLPRGATVVLRTILKEHGLKVKWVDRRTEGNPGLHGMIPPHTVDLWDYQDEAVEAGVTKENCLIRAPTGSGKTTAALALAARINFPTIVIVYNGGLFDQWVQRCVNELGMDKRDVGQLRGGKYKLRPITIAMQQSLNKLSEEKWDELNATFGCVICDEVQRFAARTFLATIDRFTARYRIGISADETRKDRKEFLVYDVFGQVAYKVSRELLIKREFVHDVEVRIIPTDFRADWYGEAHDAGEVPNHNQLLDEMTHDADRNDLIMRWAVAEVKWQNQTLAFSHRRDHCAALGGLAVAHGIVAGILLGGQTADDTREFNRTVERIRVGELWFAAGTYQAIGQGLDLPSVCRGMATTPIATNRQVFGQARGRLCRKDTATGKENAVLYYFWDQHVFGIEHVRNIARWNKTVSVWTPGREGLIPADEYIEQQKGSASGKTKAQRGSEGAKLYFLKDRLKR